MTNIDTVTIVIINYNTVDLTIRAVHSIRQWYPTIPLLIIDNGSTQEKLQTLHNGLETEASNTTFILNKKNLHHGPGMDQALHSVVTPYILFFDSDCILLRGEIVDRMTRRFDNPMVYAVGHHIFMNDRGFDVASSENAHSYIRPYCMMICRHIYFQLPAFQHHGAPCLDNMKTARDSGYQLVDFPVQEYVSHEGRGTAGRYGYRLGFRGKINHALNKLGL